MQNGCCERDNRLLTYPSGDSDCKYFNPGGFRSVDLANCACNFEVWQSVGDHDADRLHVRSSLTEQQRVRRAECLRVVRLTSLQLNTVDGVDKTRRVRVAAEAERQ